MAQLTTVLPNTYLLEACEGGPEYRTTVKEGAQGDEFRVVWWTTARHRWTVTYAGLLSEVQAVINLIDEAKGMGYSFLWTPPGYTQGSFRLATDHPQIVWRSNDVTEVSFELVQVVDE